jgi:hypothetical protein
MISRMPEDYQIPDEPDAGRMDAAYLRSCLGLRAKLGENPPELPLAVRRAHYDMARSLSILGATGPTGMDSTQLATVVALAIRDETLGKLPEPEPQAYSFMPEVEAGRVADGQKLVVYWRKKDWPAHFLRADGDRLVLLHEGDERRFRADLVRYPEEGEFPEAADNINTMATV